MPDLDTRTRIIFALVRKNGQTFTELLHSIIPKTNHDSLSKGLNFLKEDGLIKQEGRLYYFSTKIKNPLLLSLKGSYTMAHHLEGFNDEIKEMEDPFPITGMKIYNILLLQTRLNLERYTTPKLTKREKLEFDLFTDIFDAEIELMFKILQKMDARKTRKLKDFLTAKICKPIMTEKKLKPISNI